MAGAAAQDQAPGGGRSERRRSDATGRLPELPVQRAEAPPVLRRRQRHLVRRRLLAVHNTWHLALFELELGGHDEALRLYDRAIAGDSTLVVDLIDAGVMLQRLQLRGVVVCARWAAVADCWDAALGADGLSGDNGADRYAFNDFHGMLAYAGADRMAA